jgi:hypothetical protein
LVSKESSYCQLVRIESIQIDDISKELVNITSEIEVGLQFNADAKKGLSLYLIEDN